MRKLQELGSSRAVLAVKCKVIKTQTSVENRARCTIATGAWMPRSEDYPVCKSCGNAMQFFLQSSINVEFGLPFQEGSHFVLFMCPECNEIPSFENYIDGKLPVDFWEKTEGHFYAAMYKPGAAEKYVDTNSFLQSFLMQFRKDDENRSDNDAISFGGNPTWLQDSESYSCSCGSPMTFFCQIAENYPFPKIAGAPSQPDSFSESDYCLFLGNEIYVFGCEKQCHERAIWITVQN